MRALAVAALLIMLLCGFPGCNVRSNAPVADADASCYQAALPSVNPPDTGVRWTCNAEDPACWDDLANRVVPTLTSIALAGERNRQACAGFITDLKKRGVLRAKP
jgi:hypothetical protein